MSKPFMIAFNSDTYEFAAAAINEGGATNTLNQKGFKLCYFQTAC